jgi:hypothetical protein
VDVSPIVDLFHFFPLLCPVLQDVDRDVLMHYGRSDFWGEVYSTSRWDPAATHTLFSSLRKYPSFGHHPLPQVTKLTSLLAAFARSDEARRDFDARLDAMFAVEVPHCRHPNHFWFPEEGKVLMDTMRPQILLTNMPNLLLCSDCGLLLKYSYWKGPYEPSETSS